MYTHVKKVVVRGAFETVVDRLKSELFNDGFEVGGITDFQNPTSRCQVTHTKHKVLSVFYGFLYKEMITQSPFAGIVFPCVVSVIELYPGEIAIFSHNATEHIARAMSLDSIENLAKQVGKRLDDVIHVLENTQNKYPDLVTSWG